MFVTILHSVQIQHTAGCLPGWVRRSALHLHDTAHCRVSTWLSSPVGPPPSWYSTLHGVYLVEFAGRPSTFMIQHTAGCLPGWVRRSALPLHDTAHCRVSTWLSSPVGPPPSWYSTLQGVYLVEFAGRPSTFMIQHTAGCLPGWVRRSALHLHDTAHCRVSTWLSSPVGPPPSWYSTLQGVYLVEFAGRPSTIMIQHTAGCLPGWVRRSALHHHDTAHCRVSTWLSSPVGPPPSWYSTLQGVYLVEFAGRPSTFMIQHTAGCLPGWVRRSALHLHDTAHCRVSTWLSSPVGPPPSWYSTLQGVYLVEFAGRPSTFMIQHTAGCLPGWVRRSALHLHDTAHCRVSTWLSSPVGPPPSWYSTLHGVYLVEFAGRPSTFMIQHTAGCLPGWVRRSALHLHDTAHCRVSTWLSSPVGPPPSWYSTLQGVYLVEFAGRPSTIMIQHTAGCLPGWVRRSALHLHDTAHCRVSTWLSSPVGPPPSWYSTLQGVYLVEFAGRPSTFMIQHTAGCLPGWVRRSALHLHDTAHCRVSTWLSSPVGPPPSWYSTLQGVYLVEFAGRPSTFMIQHTAGCLPGWVRRSALHLHDTAHCTVSTWLSSPVGPPPSWYSTLQGVYLVEFAGRPSTFMIQHTAGCLPGWVRRSALHLHERLQLVGSVCHVRRQLLPDHRIRRAPMHKLLQRLAQQRVLLHPGDIAFNRFTHCRHQRNSGTTN